MIDGVTLNQLRTFVSVCDEASFSKASRHLQRAQSAISHAVSALEATLGVTLFERTGRKPELTSAGRLLLADARAVIARTEELKTRAKWINESGAPVLSLAVDNYFPRAVLIAALVDLKKRAPTVQISLQNTMMQRGEALVLEGRCNLALVVADTPHLNGGRIERKYLREMPMVTVCSPSHPLAQLGAMIPSEEYERHTQIVVSDHGASPADFKKGVAGERNWLVADLSTKHDFLKAGLGWGNMPENIVAKDLTAGRLIILSKRPLKSLTFVTSMLRGRGLSASEAWLIGRLTDEKTKR